MVRDIRLTIIASALAVIGIGLIQKADAQSANNPGCDKIIQALTSTTSRGLAASASSSKAAADEAADKIIQNLLAVAKTRSLSEPERTELADAASSRPNIDLEINFDFDSSSITEKAKPSLTELGKALTSSTLKGANFLVAGHTDAKGRPSYNKNLSEQRAEAVRQYLMEHYGIDGSQLLAIGYGSERLKNPQSPYSGENRRVQIVNISPNVASNK